MLSDIAPLDAGPNEYEYELQPRAILEGWFFSRKLDTQSFSRHFATWKERRFRLRSRTRLSGSDLLIYSSRLTRSDVTSPYVEDKHREKVQNHGWKGLHIPAPVRVRLVRSRSVRIQQHHYFSHSYSSSTVRSGFVADSKLPATAGAAAGSVTDRSSDAASVTTQQWARAPISPLSLPHSVDPGNPAMQSGSSTNLRMVPSGGAEFMRGGDTGESSTEIGVGMAAVRGEKEGEFEGVEEQRAERGSAGADVTGGVSEGHFCLSISYLSDDSESESAGEDESGTVDEDEGDDRPEGKEDYEGHQYEGLEDDNRRIEQCDTFKHGGRGIGRRFMRAASEAERPMGGTLDDVENVSIVGKPTRQKECAVESDDFSPRQDCLLHGSAVAFPSAVDRKARRATRNFVDGGHFSTKASASAEGSSIGRKRSAGKRSRGKGDGGGSCGTRKEVLIRFDAERDFRCWLQALQAAVTADEPSSVSKKDLPLAPLTPLASPATPRTPSTPSTPHFTRTNHTPLPRVGVRSSSIASSEQRQADTSVEARMDEDCFDSTGARTNLLWERAGREDGVGSASAVSGLSDRPRAPRRQAQYETAMRALRGYLGEQLTAQSLALEGSVEPLISAFSEETHALSGPSSGHTQLLSNASVGSISAEGSAGAAGGAPSRPRPWPSRAKGAGEESDHSGKHVDSVSDIVHIAARSEENEGDGPDGMPHKGSYCKDSRDGGELSNISENEQPIETRDETRAMQAEGKKKEVEEKEEEEELNISRIGTDGVLEGEGVERGDRQRGGRDGARKGDEEEEERASPGNPAEWEEVRRRFDGALVPRMNVLIMAVGTRGDVEPFLHLGRRLLQDGHRVRIATHATYRAFVTGASTSADAGTGKGRVRGRAVGGGGGRGSKQNLEFYPLAGDPVKLSEYMVRNQGFVLPTSRELVYQVPQYHAMVVEIIRSCWGACVDPDPGDPDAGISDASIPDASVRNEPDAETPVDWMGSRASKGRKGGKPFRAQAIISNPVTYAHVHCAEALGVPLHLMFPQPWVPTKAFPHPMSRLSYSSGWRPENYLSYQLIDLMFWLSFERELNAFRTQLLGLPPIRLGEAGWNGTHQQKIPFACMWSPSLVPKPKDWPDGVDVVGAFHAPEVLKPAFVAPNASRNVRNEVVLQGRELGEEGGGGEMDPDAPAPYQASADLLAFLGAGFVDACPGTGINATGFISPRASQMCQPHCDDSFGEEGSTKAPEVSVRGNASQWGRGARSAASGSGAGSRAGSGAGTITGGGVENRRPIVFVGFGSMVVQPDRLRALVALMLEAAAIANVRLIVQAGWSSGARAASSAPASAPGSTHVALVRPPSLSLSAGELPCEQEREKICADGAEVAEEETFLQLFLRLAKEAEGKARNVRTALEAAHAPGWGEHEKEKEREDESTKEQGGGLEKQAVCNPLMKEQVRSIHTRDVLSQRTVMNGFSDDSSGSSCSSSGEPYGGSDSTLSPLSTAHARSRAAVGGSGPTSSTIIGDSCDEERASECGASVANSEESEDFEVVPEARGLDRDRDMEADRAAVHERGRGSIGERDKDIDSERSADGHSSQRRPSFGHWLVDSALKFVAPSPASAVTRASAVPPAAFPSFPSAFACPASADKTGSPGFLEDDSNSGDSSSHPQRLAPQLGDSLSPSSMRSEGRQLVGENAESPGTALRGYNLSRSIVCDSYFPEPVPLADRSNCPAGTETAAKEMVMGAEWTAERDALLIGPCPHAWLFERVDAVIHHGGAGTTSAGLLSGCPTWVCPFFGDQFFWGEMLHKAGVGPAPSRVPAHAVSLHAAVHAMEEITGNETIKANARALGARLRERGGPEDGVENALQAFYRHLPLQRMCCDVSWMCNRAQLAEVFCEDCGLKMSLDVCLRTHAPCHLEKGSELKHEGGMQESISGRACLRSHRLLLFCSPRSPCQYIDWRALRTGEQHKGNARAGSGKGVVGSAFELIPSLSGGRSPKRQTGRGQQRGGLVAAGLDKQGEGLLRGMAALLRELSGGLTGAMYASSSISQLSSSAVSGGSGVPAAAMGLVRGLRTLLMDRPFYPSLLAAPSPQPSEVHHPHTAARGPAAESPPLSPSPSLSLSFSPSTHIEGQAVSGSGTENDADSAANTPRGEIKKQMRNQLSVLLGELSLSRAAPATVAAPAHASSGPAEAHRSCSSPRTLRTLDSVAHHNPADLARNAEIRSENGEEGACIRVEGGNDVAVGTRVGNVDLRVVRLLSELLRRIKPVTAPPAATRATTTATAALMDEEGSLAGCESLQVSIFSSRSDATEDSEAAEMGSRVLPDPRLLSLPIATGSTPPARFSNTQGFSSSGLLKQERQEQWQQQRDNGDNDGEDDDVSASEQKGVLYSSSFDSADEHSSFGLEEVDDEEDEQEDQEKGKGKEENPVREVSEEEATMRGEDNGDRHERGERRRRDSGKDANEEQDEEEAQEDSIFALKCSHLLPFCQHELHRSRESSPSAFPPSPAPSSLLDASFSESAAVIVGGNPVIAEQRKCSSYKETRDAGQGAELERAAQALVNEVLLRALSHLPASVLISDPTHTLCPLNIPVPALAPAPVPAAAPVAASNVDSVNANVNVNADFSDADRVSANHSAAFLSSPSVSALLDAPSQLHSESPQALFASHSDPAPAPVTSIIPAHPLLIPSRSPPLVPAVPLTTARYPSPAAIEDAPVAAAPVAEVPAIWHADSSEGKQEEASEAAREQHERDGPVLSVHRAFRIVIRGKRVFDAIADISSHSVPLPRSAAPRESLALTVVDILPRTISSLSPPSPLSMPAERLATLTLLMERASESKNHSGASSRESIENAQHRKGSTSQSQGETNNEAESSNKAQRGALKGALGESVRGLQKAEPKSSMSQQRLEEVLLRALARADALSVPLPGPGPSSFAASVPLPDSVSCASIVPAVACSLPSASALCADDAASALTAVCAHSSAASRAGSTGNASRSSHAATHMLPIQDTAAGTGEDARDVGAPAGAGGSYVDGGTSNSGYGTGPVNIRRVAKALVGGTRQLEFLDFLLLFRDVFDQEPETVCDDWQSET